MRQISRRCLYQLVSTLILLFLPLFSHAQSLPLFDETPHQLTLAPPSTATFTYYSFSPSIAPTHVFILVHGHPHDVKQIIRVEKNLSRLLAFKNTLFIAPFFDVDTKNAARCTNKDTPESVDTNAKWNCRSWMSGGLAEQGDVSAFQAMDHLISHLLTQWPSLTQVTLAGFSAGAQFTQHYIGFAQLPANIDIRYIVSDPGSWLYFSPDRINTSDISAQCSSVNVWKYGMDLLPSHLKEQQSTALTQYKRARITYLVGENDQLGAKHSFTKTLDKSCAANAQGVDRYERAIRYAEYDKKMINPTEPHLLYVVPKCSHEVQCVFESKTVINLLSSH